MSLRPSLLFSTAAKSRCLAKIKDFKIPRYTDKTDKEISDKILSAVLVPLCVENDQVCLLYTLRSTKLARHSGQVSFPGGKQDNDETAIETALRETEEEIGFPRDSVDVWGTMHSVPAVNGKMLIKPVVGLLNDFDMKALVRSEDEVDEIFTVSMEALCNTENHAHFMWQSISLPIFECGKHKIWGVTGMITHIFLSGFLSSDVYKPDFMRKSFTYEQLQPSKL